jgi:hypothetical protein
MRKILFVVRRMLIRKGLKPKVLTEEEQEKIRAKLEDYDLQFLRRFA